jgi:hypothetical protein
MIEKLKDLVKIIWDKLAARLKLQSKGKVDRE